MKSGILFFTLLIFSINAVWVVGQDSLALYLDGTSEYRIVLNKKPGEQEKLAAVAFQNLFRECTGFNLPIEQSRKKTAEFSIVLQTEDPASGLELGQDGFLIETRGQTLMISGGPGKGLLYGVDSFFEKFLGFRWYASDARMVPQSDTVLLPRVSEKQVPYFKFRETYYAGILDNEDFANWLKADNHRSDWGMWVHTFQRLIPPEQYFEDHPEYFAERKGKRTSYTQLCLSNENMQKELINNLRTEIGKNPEAQYWSVSQNDNTQYCTCPDCRALDSLYGGPSGTLLHFVNQVAREFPEKTISTLAYQYSRAAPKHIVPEPNLNIMFCSIECNRSVPIPDDTSSILFRKDLEDWSALTSNILVWDYVIQFENLLSPFPNLRVLQPNIQYFANMGATAMFQQGNRETGGEFSELRAYLIAKLLWDPWLDMDVLMDGFLNGYYGPAGPYIREYIDLMHEALDESGAGLWIFGGPADHPGGYLSWDLINEYSRIFDLAEETTADAPGYLERVKNARLPLSYAVLELSRIEGKSEHGIFVNNNGKWSVKPETWFMLDEFKADCDRNGISRLKEWNLTPDDYFVEFSRLLEKGLEMHLGYEKPVRLTWPYSEKYTGGSDNALTDGLQGTSDFHHVWQGFEENDLEAVIDLGKTETIELIEINFLQDIRQWIFMPEHISFFGSLDGTTFTELGSIENRVALQDAEVQIKKYDLLTEPVEVRYVKVHAGNIGTCPDWHMGSGGKAWIFCDEIIIK